MPSFSLSRDIGIRAEPAIVHDLINNFRNWREWSPWEDLDPNLEREYTGPESGVGSRYAWKGNQKAGAGTMEIVDSTPRSVEVDLKFLAPFKASNEAVFTLTPEGEETRLDWTMTGNRNLLFAVAGKLFFDRAISKEFEQGLASIKELAERRGRLGAQSSAQREATALAMTSRMFTRVSRPG